MTAEKISFTLRPHAPFSLELTVWALRRRASNQVDRWDGKHYSRIFTLEKKPVQLIVSQDGGIDRPQLNVSIIGASSLQVKSGITSFLDKIFSLRRDFSEFYALSNSDSEIGPVVQHFLGMKPPRFPSVFEALVNAFTCQQVTLDLGIILLNRLSQSYGVAFSEGAHVVHAFPTPEDLAGLSPEDFRQLGYSRNKGRAIIELSEGIIKGSIKIEEHQDMGDSEIIQNLLKIRGVGRWTAEYALLRGFGRINVFPGDDAGAQKNIQRFLGLEEVPDYEMIKKITSRWHPYAGFIYFHLLLEKLRIKGYIS